VLALYGRFAELTAGTLRVDPLEVRAEGPDTVVATHRTVGDRPDGRHIDTTARLVITIADGRILNIDEESAEPDRVDGFWV
jgi:ketosteroid isomerase-like protein